MSDEKSDFDKVEQGPSDEKSDLEKVEKDSIAVTTVITNQPSDVVVVQPVRALPGRWSGGEINAPCCIAICCPCFGLVWAISNGRKASFRILYKGVSSPDCSWAISTVRFARTDRLLNISQFLFIQCISLFSLRAARFSVDHGLTNYSYQHQNNKIRLVYLGSANLMAVVSLHFAVAWPSIHIH